ncbi:MAG: hypothetical protein A2Z02_06365 [Chloroflexi bacterium RBG_16_48_7]|nr:MAG: hypothetical protein A2Z02_06365 [Chloroflexi bacterium RBG_16_48_7]
MYDVIIVGGGPTGSYAACKLAQLHHKVLVLERKRRIGESVCCTGIISQECVTAFGIDDKFILRQANSARLLSPSGNELRLWRKNPQASILDRAAFDMAMAARAQSAGADYVLNSPVKDIAIEKDGVNIQASCQGKGINFKGRVIILACGFGTTLCERLGMGRPGDFTIGAQTEIEAAGVEETEVYLGNVAPGFFAWLVPTRPPIARVGLMTRKDPDVYLRKWLAHLAARGKIASADAEISYAGIPLKPLPRTCGERVVVIGEAAGQIKPTSGGGIYYGLLCADIAAKILHQALEDDDLSAKRLTRYEREWRKKLGQELKTGYRARKLFERLSDKQIDRIFEIIKTNRLDEALLRAEDLSFDWHSKSILRLMGYQMISRALSVIKLPFRIG